MSFFIHEISICGIKNIDQKITLNFSNQTIGKNFEFQGTNIKGIYGPNGSGKTAVVLAMYIYQYIIRDGINADSHIKQLISESINKKTKQFDIQIIFSFIGKKELNTINHWLSIKKENEGIKIVHEKISLLQKAHKINAQPLFTLESENGKLIEPTKKNDLDEKIFGLIDDATKNTLNDWSIIRSVYKNCNPSLLPKKIKTLIIVALLFASSFIPFMDKNDLHFNYFNALNSKDLKENDLNEIKQNKLREEIKYDGTKQYLVPIKKWKKFQNYVQKLTRFIQIFKPNLKSIEIDKRVDHDVYHCSLILQYPNITIDQEFESTGIKKLIKLFPILHDCANGGIAFIDELDANLHDVYLTKLLNFFVDSCKGQLCFTSHNLDPIDILKKNKYSIDFLSANSKIFNWTKDGNKSPKQRYMDGLIPYSPFNVEDIDFEILLDDEK